MSLEKKYNSIDQSKLKPAVRDILKKMKEKSENFTNSDINKKVEPALDKLLMRLEKELPEAIKKATKTPSKPKAKPKAKAKAKPKTKSTKETFTQKASKLMKKEGISWAEAKNKLSKQLKDEKDKVEKDIKSDNKQALNELDKLIKSTEFKKDLGKFPKKSSGEERELTSDISADGKRQALPRGKRKSKNGKTYYEYRDNRSDVNSLPAPKGQYRYKGKTPPYLEAGGTLPTPFGQAGLVGETGTMNEVDLFAMGGGLPQGVHQYYGQTYNPAYPTPHGYAKGGRLSARTQFSDYDFDKLSYDFVVFNDRVETEDGKVVGTINSKGHLVAKGDKTLKNPLVKWLQQNSYVSNDEYYKLAKGGDIPVGFHKMPNGEIMADSEHLAEGGETIDGFTLNTIKGVANKPTNVDIDKLDINYAEGGVILTYNKPNKVINLTNVKSKEDFDNLIKHYKENASSIHYINESDIKRNKHWLVVVKYKDNDDFIVNNFSNKKEAKELFNHYQDMETVDFVNLFDLDGTTYAEGGEIEVNKNEKIIPLNEVRKNPNLKREFLSGKYLAVFEKGKQTAIGVIKTPKELFDGRHLGNVYSERLKNGKIKIQFGKEYYEKGGEVDLFEDYEKQPKELSEIVETYQERYADGDMDYESTKEFLGKVNAIGYTFDSGLDNEPFGLRKMAKGGEIDWDDNVTVFQFGKEKDANDFFLMADKFTDYDVLRLSPFAIQYVGGKEGFDFLYERAENYESNSLDIYAKGGRTKHSLMQDRRRVSSEPWEVAYQKRKSKMEKGGTTKQGYDYVPQEAIDELSYTMGKVSKSVSGSNVLSGAYVKSGAKPKTKSKGANDLTKRLLAMTDDEDKTKVILEKDVKEMQKYVSDKLIIAFYLGLPKAYDFKGDYSYGGGIINYDLNRLKKRVADTLKNIKGNKFEMGLKYPQYDFEKLLGKPTIKDVFGKTTTFNDGSTEKYKYRLWIWKDCVIGQTIGSESSRRGGYTDYTYGEEPTLMGGYKSVQTSKESKLESIAKFMADDKNGFVKDNDVLYNGLGGTTFETLDKNKIKYQAGGTLPTPFGQAGLVGETGTMNEVDLFAMGGGLPQGVHQYYAQTYNPAYPTPHGYEKGGKIGFDGLAKKVAKKYEGKPVKADFQSEYGKTYSKAEAMEVGKKVAGKVYQQQQSMAKGGKTQGYNDKLDESLGNTKGKRSTKEQNYKDRRNESEAMENKGSKRKYSSVKTMDKGNRSKRRTPMSLAKEIRKEGENWQQAVKRASAILKKEYADK